ALRIRLRCPSCRLPMVGTSAMRAPPWRRASSSSRKGAKVSNTCTSGIAVFRAGKTAALHCRHIGFDGTGDAAVRFRQEVLDELRRNGGDAQDAVQHLDLAIDMRPRADTTDWYAQLFADAPGEADRDTFQQQQAGALRFQQQSFFHDGVGGVRIATLHTVAT